MKVSELIEQLKELPQDKEVTCESCCGNCTVSPVGAYDTKWGDVLLVLQEPITIAELQVRPGTRTGRIALEEPSLEEIEREDLKSPYDDPDAWGYSREEV